MRQRINRQAVCSCSGNNGSYESSKRAHKAALEEGHESFQVECKSFIMKVSDEPAPDTLVYVMLFGDKIKLPYSKVKACKFKWSWS